MTDRLVRALHGGLSRYAGYGEEQTVFKGWADSLWYDSVRHQMNSLLDAALAAIDEVEKMWP